MNPRRRTLIKNASHDDLSINLVAINLPEVSEILMIIMINQLSQFPFLMKVIRDWKTRPGKRIKPIAKVMNTPHTCIQYLLWMLNSDAFCFGSVKSFKLLESLFTSWDHISSANSLKNIVSVIDALTLTVDLSELNLT